MELDVLIFGGGGAGLWLLNEVTRRGFDALLVEAHALGKGQTISSQGIIHGGIKYSLRGLLTDSGRAIREMPQLWRDCLSGKRQPDLSRTSVLAHSCYLWHTGDFAGRFGILGAKKGLRSEVEHVEANERPLALANSPLISFHAVDWWQE